jgi:hypothetical protein
VVGIRRIDEDGNPMDDKIYTPSDINALENPCVIGEGVMGTKGAVIITENGEIKPNYLAPKT